MRDQFDEDTAKPPRKPGSMEGLIKIRPGFEEADKVEALFHAEPIEPPPRSRREEIK